MKKGTDTCPFFIQERSKNKMKKIKCKFLLAFFCLLVLSNSVSVFASENASYNPNVSYRMQVKYDYVDSDNYKMYNYKISISNAKQPYKVICVYSFDDKHNRYLAPFVFATDGSVLDADIKVLYQDARMSGAPWKEYLSYNTATCSNLAYIKTSDSKKFTGFKINLPVRNENHYLEQKPTTNMPCLKYPDSVSIGFSDGAKYALNLYEGNGNTFEGDSNYSGSNEYESDLSGIGYLQNVTFHTNYVDGIDSDNTYSYITYDSMTNTGFDITKSGVNIALYTAPRFAYCPSLGDYLKNTPTVVYGDKMYCQKSSGSDCRIDFSMLELRSAYNSEAQLYQQKAFVGTPVILKLQYWLRVEYDSPNGNKCGGWVRIADDDNSAAETNKRTETFDPDGKKTTDGGYSDGTSTSDKTGHGQTQEEASNNETDSITTGGNDGYNDVSLAWFLDQLSALKNSLGQFPQLVSAVFGWLPAPVITLVGVGIAIVIIVSLIKAVRG